MIKNTKYKLIFYLSYMQIFSHIKYTAKITVNLIMRYLNFCYGYPKYSRVHHASIYTRHCITLKHEALLGKHHCSWTTIVLRCGQLQECIFDTDSKTVARHYSHY